MRTISKRSKLGYELYQMVILQSMLGDPVSAEAYLERLHRLCPNYPYLKILAGWIDHLYSLPVYRSNPPSEEDFRLYKRLYDWAAIRPDRFTDEEVSALSPAQRTAFYDFKDKLKILLEGGRLQQTVSDQLTDSQLNFVRGIWNRLQTNRKAKAGLVEGAAGLSEGRSSPRAASEESRFTPAKFDARCKICNTKYPKDTLVHIGTWTHKNCFESLNINIPSRFVPGSPDFIPPSPYQEAIKLQFTTSNAHIIIDAKAGSGKTTTLEWLLCTTYDKNRHIVTTAFNKSIRTELKERIEKAKLVNVEAFTLNSYGFSVIRKSYPEIKWNQWKIDSKKIKKLVERPGFGPDGRGFPIGLEEIKERYNVSDPDRVRDIKNKNKIIRDVFQELADKARQNLETPDQYDALIEKYKIPVDELTPEERKMICDLLPEVLDLSVKAVEQDFMLDYVDQNWLPIAKQYQTRTGKQIVLPKTFSRLRDPKHYDLDVMLVDEAQDLNKSQAEFALMCVGGIDGRGRLIIVGDPFQSIYSWAGADSRSMKNLEALLAPTRRGVAKMPLSVSWRCPLKVIQYAQSVLANILEPGDSNIQPRPNAGEGQILTQIAEHAISSFRMEDAELVDGKVPAMVLCRANAPLFSFAFQILKRGIPIKIQGRDICKNLIDYLDEINPGTGKGKKRIFNQDIPTLHNAIVSRRLELSRLEKATDQNFDLELDKLEILEMFASKPDIKNVEQIKSELDSMFTSGHCPECAKDPDRKPYKADADDIYCPVCIEDIPAQDGKPARTGKVVKIIKRSGVLFSSVHKAKGLEAFRVYILSPERLGVARRDATEEERIEEIHIQYVAVTRALYSKSFPETSGILTFVISDDKDQPVERRDFHPSEWEKESDASGSNYSRSEEDQASEEDDDSDISAIETSFSQTPTSSESPITPGVPLRSLTEIQGITLPSLPSKGSGLFSEPKLEDWVELKAKYLAVGIPAKIVKLPGWHQYALIVNGVACASTTVNIGGSSIRKKGVLALRVTEPDERGIFLKTPQSARDKGLPKLTIKRTSGWKGRVLEAINGVLLTHSPSMQETRAYNAMKDLAGESPQKRFKRLRRYQKRI